MLKVINMTELLDYSLLGIVNSLSTNKFDSNGKYHLNLRARRFEDSLKWFIDKELHQHKEFGVNIIIYNSCCVDSNWRAMAGEKGTGCLKYHLIDDSINFDLYDLSYVSDKIFNELKCVKSLKQYFIQGDTIDYYDFVAITKTKLGFSLVENNSKKTILIDDANRNFCHDSFFLYQQVQEVETKLREVNLY